MVLEIPKGASPEEVQRLVKDFEEKIASQRKKKSMRDFYGALKGAFGDPIECQKKLRSEWD